jgi:type VI secretion system secreted protein Hcp
MLGIGHDGGLSKARAGATEPIGKILIEGIAPAGHEPEVLSWSLGASNPTSVGSSGMSAGKVSYSDLSVMISLDKSSPLLLKALATGKHIKTVKLSLFDKDAADQPIDNPVITLTDVLVSKWKDTSEVPGALESVSFAYSKITYSYSKEGASSSMCWDLATNKKC